MDRTSPLRTPFQLSCAATVAFLVACGIAPPDDDSRRPRGGPTAASQPSDGTEPSTGASGERAGTATAPAPAMSPQEVTRAINSAIDFLQAGQEEQAEAELTKVLASDPTNSQGQMLLKQIKDDPNTSLGRESFAYEVKLGESLSSIARKFMGDTQLFYILARYNGIKVPKNLPGGATIKVPGNAPPVQQRVDPVPASPPPPPAVDPGKAKAEAVARYTKAARSAFAKEDLAGAIRSWDAVLAIEPDNRTALLERQKAAALMERLGKVTPPRDKSRCATEGLPAFAWPQPPQPSVSALIPRRLLFGADLAPKSLSDVAARLDAVIAEAGYLQPRYMGAGCRGFAVVLDLEHIQADGARMAGAQGFAPPGQDEAFSMLAYLQRLFYAAPGHYRQIVLVVSDQRMTGTGPPPTEGTLRALARDARSTLPPPYASLPFSPDYEVLALIYEFRKGPRDGDAQVIPPQGRLGATVHLKMARLY